MDTLVSRDTRVYLVILEVEYLVTQDSPDSLDSQGIRVNLDTPVIQAYPDIPVRLDIVESRAILVFLDTLVSLDTQE